MEKELKIGFFKKVWYSITKIEKYPNMATQGVKESMFYLAKIVIILSIIISLGIIYQTSSLIKEGVNYLQNEFPEFSYKDGILNVESENEIVISEDNSVVGKTIINTKVEDEQTINKYIQDITDSGDGIIILKDKVIIKNPAGVGTNTYVYNEVLQSMGISEFTKQDVINYANSTQIISLYASIFLTIFIYSFIIYLLSILSNVILLSCFGYITTLLARIKIKYAAIFNMSIYALTLSIILNILYVVINMFVPFNMQYFQVMYIAVAAIYLVAAILILKTEIMKQQLELMKIVEAEKIIKQEMEDQEQDEKDKKEKEERKRKDKEEEKNQDNNGKEKEDVENKESKNKDTEETKKKSGESKENKNENDTNEPDASEA